MQIKNLNITSPTTLDLELDITAPVCVFCGEYASLTLDLIREVIGDCGAEEDPDFYDDGRFVILTDVDIDEKSYSICYIRNADYMGDNRIAVNFVPNSIEYSMDDTEEYMDKCAARAKDTDNVFYSYKACTVSEADDRPIFVYCDDADEISSVIDAFSALGRQVFVAVASEEVSVGERNVQRVVVS